MIIEWGQGLLKQAKQVTTTFVEELGKELKDVDYVLKEMINDGDYGKAAVKDQIASGPLKDTRPGSKDHVHSEASTEAPLKSKPQLCQDDWE